MVEQFCLLKTEKYKKGLHNFIFDSVAIFQKHITLRQTRTAENFKHSRD